MAIDALAITRKLGERTVQCYLPAPQEDLMQQCWDLHAQDERFFPFWLEEWPSAFGLYDFILQHQLQWEFAVEIGCGAGVLGQLLGDYPGLTLHTDIVPSACAFARRHIAPARGVAVMDFTQPCLKQPANLILGADLFYEDRLVQGVCDFLTSQLSSEGVAYIADPQRQHRITQTRAILAQTALQVEPLAWNYSLDGEFKQMTIWQFQKAKTH